MNLKSIQLEKVAALLLTLSLFLLTLWRFGANQCIAVVAFMVLLYRPWRQTFFSGRWLSTPTILIGLILVIWAAISISYSQAPTLLEAVQGLKVYSKILFLLFLPIALENGTKYRKWLENGLIYGVLINVSISTLYYFHAPIVAHYFGADMSQGATLTINPLQVIYMTVMALWLLAMRLIRRQGTTVDFIWFILMTLYIWFINIERSGYLLYLALLILFLFQQLGRKAIWVACILIPCIFITFYEVSPNVNARINAGIHNVVAYNQVTNPGSINESNSLGLRLAFISETLHIIKHCPLTGMGIGSFEYVHAKLYSAQQESFQATEPHNAYIYALFELGGIGLALYLCWLYCIWRFISTLPRTEKNLLRGIWLMFVIMGLTDGILALNAIAMSFIIWLSIYLCSKESVCSLP